MSMRSHAILAASIVTTCLAGCSRAGGAGSHGACQRLVGGWQGDGIVADGGQDPEAIRVVDEVMREETWRITRVLPTALQRERIGAAGGRVAAEAMYVTRETRDVCVVDIRSEQRSRSVTFTVRSDGRLDVNSSDSWYTLRMRRR